MFKNKKISVFIEASGKKEKIKSLFAELGIRNITIEATHGRLFDLPKDRLGLRKDNFNIIDREPINSYRLEHIKNSANADVVFLMTDDDIEGEVIAHDIKQYITTEKIYRLRLQSLTVSELKTALENSDVINPENVVGGLARRVYDRYIGYTHYSHDYSEGAGLTQGYVGRVITPTLSALKEAVDTPVAYINTKLLNSDGSSWNITLPINSNEQEKANGLLSLISSLPEPYIEKISVEITEDSARPMTGGEALHAYSDALNTSIKDVSTAMQELYEEGKLSYPRTDSFYLSDETIHQMQGLADYFGVEGFDEEHFARKAQAARLHQNVQAGHEGIVPLDYDYPVFSPIEDLSLKDQIMIMSIRHILRCGQKGRQVEKTKGQIRTDDPDINEWNQALSQFKHEPIIEKNQSYVIGKGNKQDINDIMNPMGIPTKGKRLSNSTLKKIPKDRKVLKIMLDNNIGRPSTYSYHANKISRRFLDNSSALNKLAEISLQQASRLTPGLLDVKIANDIEHELHNGTGTIHERVIKALTASGVKEKQTIANEYDRIIGNDNFIEDILPDF